MRNSFWNVESTVWGESSENGLCDDVNYIFCLRAFHNKMTSSKDSLSFPPLVEKYFIAEKEAERKSKQSADPAEIDRSSMFCIILDYSNSMDAFQMRAVLSHESPFSAI